MRRERDIQARDVAISRLATRQHGVVTAAQLAEVGLSSGRISERAGAGRLHRIHRGVYAVGHRRLSNEGRWIAAVLACGEGAVLSHGSAAALWGIRPPRSGPVEITVPSTAGKRNRGGITLHRSTTLIAASCTSRQGIPVTTPARTLDDLRSFLSPAQLSSAVREAEFRRLPLGDERGDGARPELTPRSELEARMLALCRRHRLPQPGVNVSIDLYVVDFLWADASLIVEVDGWESHRTGSAFEEDRARDARLAVLGYQVLRFTWRQVERDSRGVAATIRARLRARN